MVNNTKESMNIWQADFYKRPVTDAQGETLWELLICSSTGSIIYEAKTPQSQANVQWLTNQLQQAIKNQSPYIIQVFRPQSVSLLTLAAEKLGIKVEPTRRTQGLREVLQKRDPQCLVLDQPAPQPLPDNLWGEQWRFATFKAGDLLEFFQERPIPILEINEELWPINLGLASSLPIGGIVIYGGRKSMILARWLAEQKPVSINHIPTVMGQSGGLVLESGLVDRWIIATYEDPEVAQAAQNYQQKQQASQGLHFLVVQPDTSGLTYTGFWLLKDEYR